MFSAPEEYIPIHQPYSKLKPENFFDVLTISSLPNCRLDYTEHCLSLFTKEFDKEGNSIDRDIYISIHSIERHATELHPAQARTLPPPITSYSQSYHLRGICLISNLDGSVEYASYDLVMDFISMEGMIIIHHEPTETTGEEAQAQTTT